MAVNLSVKNVPDELAERLRVRAERNRRSLQRELLSILESAVDDRSPATHALERRTDIVTIEDAVAQARKLFPSGTASSVAFIRALRDGR